MNRRWRVAGINFSHMHMGDLLRNVNDHSNAEIVGICDENREVMQPAMDAFGVPDEHVFTNYAECMEKTKPDLVILCPPTGEHALWVERIAPYHVDLFVEKPFAASLTDADRMINAAQRAGKKLMINWPLRWERSHYATWRLISDGVIGDVFEVHHYGGNRGPLYHGAAKVEFTPTVEDKKNSWWYKLEAGGGSLRDYLGYGVTLGTWYNGGQKPIDVTCVTTASPGLEVDEHSITIARYANGLSKFETRWGTFSDPWVHQPQPKCGFIVRGTAGTISSFDYDDSIRVQTNERPEGYDHPVQDLPAGQRNGIEYMLSRLADDLPIEGPVSPEISRVGQQIIDTAIQSATENRSIPLIEN